MPRDEEQVDEVLRHPASHLDKARNSKAVDADHVSLTTAVFSERQLAQRAAVFNLK